MRRAYNDVLTFKTNYNADMFQNAAADRYLHSRFDFVLAVHKPYFGISGPSLTGYTAVALDGFDDPLLKRATPASARFAQRELFLLGTPSAEAKRAWGPTRDCGAG